MTCQATGSCHRHLPQPETETVRAGNQHIYETSNQNNSIESHNSQRSSKPSRLAPKERCLQGKLKSRQLPSASRCHVWPHETATLTKLYA